MGEFTVKDAARKTRKAIAKVHSAIADLKLCADHWRDLDNCVAEDVSQAARLPTSVSQLAANLDEIYPQRKTRRSAR